MQIIVPGGVSIFDFLDQNLQIDSWCKLYNIRMVRDNY